jgi:hypothetical protein
VLPRIPVSLTQKQYKKKPTRLSTQEREKTIQKKEKRRKRKLTSKTQRTTHLTAACSNWPESSP